MIAQDIRLTGRFTEYPLFSYILKMKTLYT